MRARLNICLAAALLSSPFGVGCGGGGTSGDSANGYAGGGSAGADAGGGSTFPGSTPPAAEDEVDNDLRRPALGDTLLYIPSATLDALVVVDGSNLSVDLVEVGETPTRVAALPGDDGAVVLGSGTHDVTIVRPQGSGAFATVTLDVLPRHNRLIVTDDGAWAFAWYSAGDAAEAVGSLQDVSAIRLEPGAEVVYNLAVGLRPTEVLVADDGERLVVVTEEGLSLAQLDALDGDTFLPVVPYLADTFQAASDREVVVTPDGRWAVVRDLNRRWLTLLDLDADTADMADAALRRDLELPDWPSDLDLTPDGAQVLVPMRELQAVALLEVPDAWLWEQPVPQEPEAEEGAEAPEAPEGAEADAAMSEPEADAVAGEFEVLDAAVTEEAPLDVSEGPVPDDVGDTGHTDAAGPVEPVGSTEMLDANPSARLAWTGQPFGLAELQADGSRALLYTTLDDTLAIGELDIATATATAWPVAKAVTSALLAPAGGTAVLRHHQNSGLAAPEAGSHGYSLVDLGTAYVKLVLTDHEPSEVAFSPDGADVFVLVPGTTAGGSQAHRLHQFALTHIPTPSAPVFVGLLPDASQVAILLDDPTGWLTLVDVDTGEVQQINSFELNSRVR